MSDEDRIKIMIDSPGPTVTIEVNGELGDLDRIADKAMVMFRDAAAICTHWGPRSGPTNMGFHAEARDFAPAQPSSMPWAPHPYPIQSDGTT